MKKGKKTGNIQKNLFKTEIPQMPEGYYSGDKPNSYLRTFAEQHIQERPYNPETDDYDVPAFDKPIESTKTTAIYNMHSYHQGKKPHDAIRRYILHYTDQKDLVLDPFCGSGGTALAALMEGRKAIAIDRSPAATFITKNYCTLVDLDNLLQSFKELKHKVESEIGWLYETHCDRCSGKATTAFTVYSVIFQCPRCLEKVPLFDCVEAEGRTKTGKRKKIKACPHCYKKDIVEEISTRSEKFGAAPVLVSCICKSGCRPVRSERRYNDINKKKREYFEKYDLGKIREIENKKIPYWYPNDRMMHAPQEQERWGVKWRAGTSNFRTVNELYTKRNLWALAAWMKAVNDDDRIKFAVSSLILGLSKMCRYDPRWSFPFPLLTGTYYMPAISKEMNALSSVSSKLERTLVRGWRTISGEAGPSDWEMMVSTQSSTDLSAIPSNTVDYIFTDPPYGDNVQYGELNFVWEAWLKLDTHWHEQEVIVNQVRGKTPEDWAVMMRLAMTECVRILKPGHWLSLCYHDTSEGTWALVQDIMVEVGFIIDRSDTALFIDTNTKSFNQLTADKVTMRDLVINYRKPKPGELKNEVYITGEEDDTTFNEKVKLIIQDYLFSNPGSSKDRIYDEVVSRMVRSGGMEPHDFESFLRQMADEVVTPVMKNLFEQKDPDLFGGHEKRRWYLKEIEISEQDEAETLMEDAAARMLNEFIKKYLEEHPELEGVHYSDLFEHYISWIGDKPRRQLADFLPDYFFKTDSGTWRLPASEDEERLKAEGRSKGTLRRIKRYLSFIEQDLPVPEKERPNDATIAEWVRHCKRGGLYEQGKLLYEKGGLNLENLTEEDQAYLEEDYDTCVRYLSRGR